MVLTLVLLTLCVGFGVSFIFRDEVSQSVCLCVCLSLSLSYLETPKWVLWQTKTKIECCRTYHNRTSGSTIIPVLNGHSTVDKTKVFKTNGSLMKIESIAECSFGAFCITSDLHQAIIGLENQFLVFFLSGRLRQVLLLFATYER